MALQRCLAFRIRHSSCHSFSAAPRISQINVSVIVCTWSEYWWNNISSCTSSCRAFICNFQEETVRGKLRGIGCGLFYNTVISHAWPGRGTLRKIVEESSVFKYVRHDIHLLVSSQLVRSFVSAPVPHFHSYDLFRLNNYHFLRDFQTSWTNSCLHTQVTLYHGLSIRAYTGNGQQL